jgi:coenzyme F420-0:L-glutamate ligase/coenzyme F420-1:gamma-L-glutamate ligase
MAIPDAGQPLVRARRLSCWGIEGVPELSTGEDLAETCRQPLLLAGGLEPWDVVVVTHKVISKAEGRVSRLTDVVPGDAAIAVAERVGQDPRMTEVILRESRRVIRAEPGVLVTETVQGFVCANSGVDRSNVGGGEVVTCLPLDPDLSADRLRRSWLDLAAGGPLGVVVTDTFGRPFREGAVNVAIGCAGIPALSDHRGLLDERGYLLHASTIGTGDEIAGLGELVMGKIDGIPLAVVRGFRWQGPESGAQVLLRPGEKDIFRD